MDQVGGRLETLQIFIFHFLWSCTFDENLKSLTLVDLEFLMGDCSLELQRSVPVKEMYVVFYLPGRIWCRLFKCLILGRLHKNKNCKVLLCNLYNVVYGCSNVAKLSWKYIYIYIYIYIFKKKICMMY